jgi:hypothetical protein
VCFHRGSFHHCSNRAASCSNRDRSAETDMGTGMVGMLVEEEVPRTRKPRGTLGTTVISSLLLLLLAFIGAVAIVLQVVVDDGRALLRSCGLGMTVVDANDDEGDDDESD